MRLIIKPNRINTKIEDGEKIDESELKYNNGTCKKGFEEKI